MVYGIQNGGFVGLRTVLGAAVRPGGLEAGGDAVGAFRDRWGAVVRGHDRVELTAGSGDPRGQFEQKGRGQEDPAARLAREIAELEEPERWDGMA